MDSIRHVADGGGNPFVLRHVVERLLLIFANADSRSFLLWRDGQDVGFFELPVYEAAPPATVWRVGVTVVVVVAVVAVVGACCAGSAPN